MKNQQSTLRLVAERMAGREMPVQGPDTTHDGDMADLAFISEALSFGVDALTLKAVRQRVSQFGGRVVELTRGRLGHGSQIPMENQATERIQE